MALGILKTTHGEIQLPVFMPVGTKATVKAVPPKDLEELEVKIILGNTYHLFLRPGHELIKKMGGLHKFMSWNGPILTDSGGYQVFSLTKLRKITEEGVEFRSHIDGSKHFLTPELSIQIQDALDSDIKMVFDECPAHDSDRTYMKKSLELTTRWAKRSKDEWQRLGKNGLLFGIVQGGMEKDLRLESLKQILDIGFNGYALGGFSVGESKDIMYDVLSSTMDQMNIIKAPIYLMGVGEPEDILFAVNLGVQMFDCVVPTRNARNGGLYTFNGKISIKQARYFDDPEPVEDTCDCYTCRNFSRAYLRHLYLSGELLSYYLNTVHNLRFFMRFMQKMRISLKNSNFEQFSADFLNNYNKDIA
ncbi:MAG: tRNA guanosine(34) transglycosylase Tgt [Proteobacteria bacterium]|nr:tRNA guanosine(34) transglycosylase Tgt [Pseudomonadota bacterium]